MKPEELGRAVRAYEEWFGAEPDVNQSPYEAFLAGYEAALAAPAAASAGEVGDCPGCGHTLLRHGEDGQCADCKGGQCPPGGEHGQAD